ncbi:leucine-rich repeat domain-containing protein [Pseudoteredinibacter isoporae]|uniref:Leucine-rich repeat (LRR) protein n=1 Tax=Pseudoteredinibacter isoporae TaxID=570281 RepID=A0A7X0JT46_9GAMM|nr:leucine-rich repeat domain-containing protein [Pseudoteredinibacter isoporae]MBB6521772.1 Leucine-rich repeat (LRR) protein [Pseudoteredinibacter isoporae]NHO87319.1 leucine-rich repeat domain-containing protein [Pseudoteredinibacter isoporae]NIB23049.1 leucine-rich repeat domain-containing protein [Pseudoteredinibacter isoporae]
MNNSLETFRGLCEVGLGADHDQWYDLDGKAFTAFDGLENSSLSGVERFNLRQEVAGMRNWRDRLKFFEKLLYLGIEGSVNQEFFDKVCLVASLKRLSIIRSRIKSIESIEALSNLTHFNFMGSPGLESFKPLKGLPGLSVLSLCGDYREIDCLDDLGELPNIESLTLSGLETKTKTYESLSSIVAMKSLRALMLYNVRFEEQGLDPLAKIQTLEYVYLSPACVRFWKKQDYQFLLESLPNLKNDWIKLAAFDAGFQREYKIT